MATRRENKRCFTERKANRLDLRPAVSRKAIELITLPGINERNDSTTMSAPSPSRLWRRKPTKGLGGKEPNMLIIGCDYHPAFSKLRLWTWKQGTGASAHGTSEHSTGTGQELRRTAARVQRSQYESREGGKLESGTATRTGAIVIALESLSEQIREYNERIDAPQKPKSLTQRVNSCAAAASGPCNGSVAKPFSRFGFFCDVPGQIVTRSPRLGDGFRDLRNALYSRWCCPSRLTMFEHFTPNSSALITHSRRE